MLTCRAQKSGEDGEESHGQFGPKTMYKTDGQTERQTDRQPDRQTARYRQTDKDSQIKTVRQSED